MPFEKKSEIDVWKMLEILNFVVLSTSLTKMSNSWTGHIQFIRVILSIRMQMRHHLSFMQHTRKLWLRWKFVSFFFFFLEFLELLVFNEMVWWRWKSFSIQNSNRKKITGLSILSMFPCANTFYLFFFPIPWNWMDERTSSNGNVLCFLGFFFPLELLFSFIMLEQTNVNKWSWFFQCVVFINAFRFCYFLPSFLFFSDFPGFCTF